MTIVFLNPPARPSADSFEQNRRFHVAHFSYRIWWVGANLLLVNCSPTTTSKEAELSSYCCRGSLAICPLQASYYSSRHFRSRQGGGVPRSRSSLADSCIPVPHLSAGTRGTKTRNDFHDDVKHHRHGAGAAVNDSREPQAVDRQSTFQTRTEL
jgi:hypothetical protein